VIIKKSEFYTTQLQTILKYIALDNPYAALGFEKEINAKLLIVKESPSICRPSVYFESDEYRDMIHKGYTIIIKVTKKQIILLDIFKWQQR